jgi:ketosteroid isomerase-like protein
VTSSENLDLVRSILAGWERGDFHSTEWADPEIEYVIAEGPVPGSWTGLASMEEGERHVLRGWAELRVLADEYRELDDERVLVLVHHRGRGKTSGLEVGQIDRGSAALFQLRDGKVTKHVVYFDPDRALADLGLEDG